MHRFDARKIKIVLFACALAALALTASGCATRFPEYVRNGFKVGPNYNAAPPAPLPEKWVDAKSPRVQLGDPDLTSWWEVFDDPILNGLLERAYKRNPTVRAAGYQASSGSHAGATPPPASAWGRLRR